MTIADMMLLMKAAIRRFFVDATRRGTAPLQSAATSMLSEPRYISHLFIYRLSLRAPGWKRDEIFSGTPTTVQTPLCELIEGQKCSDKRIFT